MIEVEYNGNGPAVRIQTIQQIQGTLQNDNCGLNGKN